MTSGRFTEEEVKAYNLLRTVFFAEDIGRYTTIVRTKFPTFRRADRCAADKESMIRENEDVADIIQSCNKVIHVNNLTADEDPELKTRAECRTILRHHLRFNCQNVYRPRNLDEANERIRNHMTDRERTEREMNEIKEKLKQAEERAKRGDESARKLQEEYSKTLNNLVSQQAEREEKIAKEMAEQISSKWSELNTQHQNEMREMRDFYGNAYNSQLNTLREEWNRERQTHEAFVEEVNRPGIRINCRIM